MGYLASFDDLPDHGNPFGVARVHKAVPEAATFLWIASKKRALTQDGLTKFRFMGPTRWPLRGPKAENYNHLFLYCSYAWNIWT